MSSSQQPAYASRRGESRRRTWMIGLVAAVLALSGCTRKSELEAVARDWCMTIRASQVLPVYPLTEDLQPGDIFLVQLPIDQQHKQYEAKGFLPFDNHLARLDPDGYGAFYDHSFEVGTPATPLPKTLLRPGKGKLEAWQDAPQAGFPSYNVSVRRGGGFSAALPISGVPIGLSLMGSDAADATVTIDKARTYGLDTVSLDAKVRDWAETNRAFLADYAPSASGDPATPGRTNYIRVVSRVYLTGRLIVTISSASTSTFGASAGAPKPVDLLTVNPGTAKDPGTVENYATGISKINGSLAETLKKATVDGKDVLLPGGSVKVVAASSRSITMAEDFIDRPLVIGYLGFDYAIGKGGQLSAPMPTYAVIEKGIAEPFFTAPQEDIFKLRKKLDTMTEPDKRYDIAAAHIGGDFQAQYKRLRTKTPPDSGKAAFNDVAVSYLTTEPSGKGRRHFVVLQALQRGEEATFAPPPPAPPAPPPPAPSPPGGS